MLEYLGNLTWNKLSELISEMSDEEKDELVKVTSGCHSIRKAKRFSEIKRFDEDGNPISSVIYLGD